jgi:hypothetical protein
MALNKPSKYPALDTVKKVLADSIAKHLTTRTSKSGNLYFGFGSADEVSAINVEFDDYRGKLSLSFGSIESVAAVNAATVENVKQAASGMTPEQRKQLIADLSKGL